MGNFFPKVLVLNGVQAKNGKNALKFPPLLQFKDVIPVVQMLCRNLIEKAQ